MTSEAESGPDRVATLLLKISSLTSAEDGSFLSPTLFKSETLSWSLFHSPSVAFRWDLQVVLARPRSGWKAGAGGRSQDGSGGEKFALAGAWVGRTRKDLLCGWGQGDAGDPVRMLLREICTELSCTGSCLPLSGWSGKIRAVASPFSGSGILRLFSPPGI